MLTGNVTGYLTNALISRQWNTWHYQRNMSVTETVVPGKDEFPTQRRLGGLSGPADKQYKNPKDLQGHFKLFHPFLLQLPGLEVQFKARHTVRFD